MNTLKEASATMCSVSDGNPIPEISTSQKFADLVASRLEDMPEDRQEEVIPKITALLF